MSAWRCLLLVQSTVKDSKIVAFGLLFRNFGGVFSFIFFRNWEDSHLRVLPWFQTSKLFDWEAVGAPCRT